MSSSPTHKRSSSSPFPHRRRHPTPLHHPSPPPPPPNLTTTLYHTHIGIFSVTWSKTHFTRSLHIHLLPSTSTTTTTTTSAATATFHLQIKPFIFWTKSGSKKIPLPNSQNQSIRIHYDLSRAKFGSGPEPVSRFHISATVSGQTALLIGDSKTKAIANYDKTQITILRREHVSGISAKKYTTKATFRGKTREITIDCTRIIANGDGPRLSFYVDNKRVLIVKHLNWKFRGNERVEIDGVHVQISWDVRNWLEIEDGCALFVFRFEKSGFDYHEDDKYFLAQLNASGSGAMGFGFEKKRGMMSRTAAGSSSSSSLSSLSSSGCGSVMEWESVEENELKMPSGFSLLVYAWKS